MRKWAVAAAMVVAALVLGATVFAEPVAWAAQAVTVTITGPVDASGNVKVHQEAVTEVLVPYQQVVVNQQPALTVDVSRFQQIRVAVTSESCQTNLLNLTMDAQTGLATLDNWRFCDSFESRTYEMPGRTLTIRCVCGGTGNPDHAFVTVWGRTG
jgi:hypothetical protein